MRDANGPGEGRPPLRLGCFPEPSIDGLDALREEVRVAEETGLDLVGIQDHPYVAGYLDTWTLLADLGARTSRVTLATDVACLPLRPPAVLAKAAATLSRLTGGRFQLGLGAGASWDAIAAMDGPRRKPGEAVAALAEAIALMREMWSGRRAVRFEGEHYRVAGVHPGPAPEHPIGIWVGAYGPRMLELIGRVADGWLPSSPYAPPERLPAMIARIEDGAAEAGRDPWAIERLYNVSGVITDGAHRGFLEGPPQQWIEELGHLALEVGMTGFIMWAEQPRAEQLRRFAEEVAPGVRDLVARG